MPSKEQLVDYVTKFSTEGADKTAALIDRIQNSARQRFRIDLDTKPANDAIEEMIAKIEASSGNTSGGTVDVDTDDAEESLDGLGGAFAQNATIIATTAASAYAFGRSIRNYILPPVDTLERRMLALTRTTEAFNDRISQVGKDADLEEKLAIDQIDFNNDKASFTTQEDNEKATNALITEREKLIKRSFIAERAEAETRKLAISAASAALGDLKAEGDRLSLDGLAFSARDGLRDLIGAEDISFDAITDLLDQALANGNIDQFQNIVDDLKLVRDFGELEIAALDQFGSLTEKLEKAQDRGSGLSEEIAQVEGQLRLLERDRGSLPTQAALGLAKEEAAIRERAAAAAKKAIEDSAERVASSIETPTDQLAKQIKDVEAASKAGLLNTGQVDAALSLIGAGIEERVTALDEQIAKRAAPKTLGIDKLSSDIQQTVLSREDKLSKKQQILIDLEKRSLEATKAGFTKVTKAVTENKKPLVAT